MNKKKISKKQAKKAPLKTKAKTQANAKSVAANKDYDKLRARVIAALGSEPQAMRQIAAKLKMADKSGAVPASNAARIRRVLDELRGEHKVVRTGRARATTYQLIS